MRSEEMMGEQCSKFDCMEPATHTLVIEEGPHGESRFIRCLRHAQFDLTMIPKVYPDSKLFVLPRREPSDA